MYVNTNIASVNANRVIKFHQENINGNFRKLSSGKRINRAGDDASGYAITERMTGQIKGLNRAERNALDGLSFLQTAEGYLSQTGKVLIRLRELAIQSANGVYSGVDRSYMQMELKQLVNEVDRIADYAEFNGVDLLQGRFQRPQDMASVDVANIDEMFFHVGSNQGQRIQVFIGDMSAEALGVRDANGDLAINLDSTSSANQAIGQVDKALGVVHQQLADFGAYNNRLTYISESLAIGSENLQAARSRIRDVNMAEEVSELVKNQILNQAQTATLAQANQRVQTVLQLLQ